jgi:DNA-binding MarR family transcriptional regulator
MDASLTTTALRAIRRVLRAADQGARRLAASTGLTPSQVLVLREVDLRGETTPGTVASTLQFGQATVTNIVDRLVAAGLVTRHRSEKDKRQVLLRSTPAGVAILDDAPNLLHERFRQRYEALPAWEQAMMLAALERLADMLDAPEDVAPLLDAGIIDRDPAGDPPGGLPD